VAHFFLDRGLGSRIVPEGPRAAGWDLTTMAERYGTDASQDIADARWTFDATDRGDAILTKDTHVAYRPAEAQVVYMCSARVFTMRNARVSGPDALALLIRNATAIQRLTDRANGPYVFGIGPNGVRRLNLKAP
jgi:hypothetical protein